MRIAPFAYTTSFVLLIACGGPEASQANNSQANVAGSAAAVAAAPLGKPVARAQAAKLMHDRHEGMEDIGDSFRVISREVKGDKPDVAKLRKEAATIARLAPHVSGWFPPGTGPDVGKTRAKADVWQKPADFAAKAKTFQQAARSFNAAAARGDMAAIRTAHADLGKSCKACHDPYRAPEDDH